MSFQPLPDSEKSEEFPTSTRIYRKPRRKRRKKQAAKKNINNKGIYKKNGFVHTMSSWTEYFTVSATWQLKHQMAYWKARAQSLEYENKILHDIIRKNCLEKSEISKSSDSVSSNENPLAENHLDVTETESDFDDEERASEGFEVSEEFIEFLKANAKYKEEARIERERLKATYSEDKTTADLEAGPSEPPENRSEHFKEIYGNKWQRIAALEMYIQSKFINESDKTKPMYWPNIPFNLG